jgi:hypothetical protein
MLMMIGILKTHKGQIFQSAEQVHEEVAEYGADIEEHY